MVVAAADMGCDGQAFRAVFQCQIIQAQILGSDILDLGMGLLQEILVIGVADHTPSAVVELNVAAADGVQLLDNGAVGGGNILQQLLMVGINGIGIFAVLLAVQFCQQLSRSRHGLAGDAVLILKLFNELVVLHKGMISRQK